MLNQKIETAIEKLGKCPASKILSNYLMDLEDGDGQDEIKGRIVKKIAETQKQESHSFVEIRNEARRILPILQEIVAD